VIIKCTKVTIRRQLQLANILGGTGINHRVHSRLLFLLSFDFKVFIGDVITSLGSIMLVVETSTKLPS
jgi:hypothetical protein